MLGKKGNDHIRLSSHVIEADKSRMLHLGAMKYTMTSIYPSGHSGFPIIFPFPFFSIKLSFPMQPVYGLFADIGHKLYDKASCCPDRILSVH